MKKALIHESQPNLIKRIYHVVFRKTISDRHKINVKSGRKDEYEDTCNFYLF